MTVGNRNGKGAVRRKIGGRGREEQKGTGFAELSETLAALQIKQHSQQP